MGVGERGVRIVGGTFGGRRISAPSGRDTRPTSDRVREAVFSAVVSRVGSLAGLTVIDLYAGSGALGLEALSRGASAVTFVEWDARAAAAIRENLETLGIGGEQARVLKARAEAAGRAWGVPSPASLLFADPPYRIESSEVRQVMEALATGGLLETGALVVYEHAAGSVPEWPEGFAGELPRRYGDTAVSFARYEGRGAE